MFAEKATSLINNNVNIGVPKLGKYSQKQHLRVITEACVGNKSAEAVTYGAIGIPSADTVLGNIRSMKWEYVKAQIDFAIRKTIELAKNQRWFRLPVVLAIDFNDDLYYGEKIPWVLLE